MFIKRAGQRYEQIIRETLIWMYVRRRYLIKSKKVQSINKDVLIYINTRLPKLQIIMCIKK